MQTKPSDKSIRLKGTKVRKEGFGKIPQESTYAGVGKASRHKCKENKKRKGWI